MFFLTQCQVCNHVLELMHFIANTKIHLITSKPADLLRIQRWLTDWTPLAHGIKGIEEQVGCEILVMIPPVPELESISCQKTSYCVISSQSVPALQFSNSAITIAPLYPKWFQFQCYTADSNLYWRKMPAETKGDGNGFYFFIGFPKRRLKPTFAPHITVRSSGTLSITATCIFSSYKRPGILSTSARQDKQQPFGLPSGQKIPQELREHFHKRVHQPKE